MAFRLSSQDFFALKCLVNLVILYGILSVIAYSILHMKHIKPLEIDAPLDQFSEARALKHVRHLSEEIDGRQEGRPGLHEAAGYIKLQLDTLADHAGPNLRFEVDETLVTGSFNIIFLGHSISISYRNITNLTLRISSAGAQETDPSVLVNGHFDGPLGSRGAGDCASCVASMLELVRLMVDSSWIPPRPVIFLFNGGEELFFLGSHGFMRTHKWRRTVGAFINLEASGTGGPDLVCQSGPGSWPSSVYAQAAIYPMAHSSAQDVFPVIPGDTDYRIFAEDYGDIPGLDIIFVFGGYFYHTAYDTVERLLPGSLQARGENLFSLVKAFTSSSNLQNAQQRALRTDVGNGTGDRAVFFDYLSMFMIFYSKDEALFLHSLPIVIFLLVPFFLHFPNKRACSWFASFWDLTKGLLFHTLGVLLAVIIPVMLAIFRLLFSSYAMSWFAHPYLAFLMFVPSSIVGLLIPTIVWGCSPTPKDVSFFKSSKQMLSEKARFWGAFGLYAFLTLAYLTAGLGGGFLTFITAMFMIPAWTSLYLTTKFFGQESLKSMAGYVIPLIPSLTFSVYFSGFLVQFLIEKMGMMGSLPQPYGYFIQDIIIAAVIGVVTGWCLGPLIPVLGCWLARSSIIQCLLQVSVVGMALASQFFPYNTAAPKRVVFQHTFHTTDANRVLASSYEFSVVDANSLFFLFKYAPEAAMELQISPEFSSETANLSDQNVWLALFPVSFMFSGSLKFPARGDDILEHYRYLPHLYMNKPAIFLGTGSRKVHLEFDLGSLEEVWVAVLNITGPLSNWSFADNKLPAPEKLNGGPPSYISRLSGKSHENWIFWLEANSSESLRVDVAVLDQHLVDASRKLKELFPSWADVTAYSSFVSSYVF